MQEKPHGGKRQGAGRKPVTDKKKQITLYVETKLIFPFVTEEKMKAKIYEFISGYDGEQLKSNVQFTKTTPESYDRPKLPDNFVDDEPLSFDRLKKEVSEQPLTRIQAESLMFKYVEEKMECQSREEHREWLVKLESDSRLNKDQKNKIKASNQ